MRHSRNTIHSVTVDAFPTTTQPRRLASPAPGRGIKLYDPRGLSRLGPTRTFGFTLQPIAEEDPCVLGPTANLTINSKFGVPVLANAAEDLGATHRHRLAGSMSHGAVSAFNGNEIITTSGGGMLVSNNPSIVEKVRHWST